MSRKEDNFIDSMPPELRAVVAQYIQRSQYDKNITKWQADLDRERDWNASRKHYKKSSKALQNAVHVKLGVVHTAKPKKSKTVKKLNQMPRTLM
jgi:hypothetical protein